MNPYERLDNLETEVRQLRTDLNDVKAKLDKLENRHNRAFGVNTLHLPEKKDGPAKVD